MLLHYIPSLWLIHLWLLAIELLLGKLWLHHHLLLLPRSSWSRNLLWILTSLEVPHWHLLRIRHVRRHIWARLVLIRLHFNYKFLIFQSFTIITKNNEARNFKYSCYRDTIRNWWRLSRRSRSVHQRKRLRMCQIRRIDVLCSYQLHIQGRWTRFLCLCESTRYRIFRWHHLRSIRVFWILVLWLRHCSLSNTGGYNRCSINHVSNKTRKKGRLRENLECNEIYRLKTVCMDQKANKNKGKVQFSLIYLYSNHLFIQSLIVDLTKLKPSAVFLIICTL